MKDRIEMAVADIGGLLLLLFIIYFHPVMYAVGVNYGRNNGLHG